MGARRYQDLEVWQLANDLKKKVYALVDRSTARDDRRFCEQLRDSAASAPSHLAEGFGCYLEKQLLYRSSRTARSALASVYCSTWKARTRRAPENAASDAGSRVPGT